MSKKTPTWSNEFLALWVLLMILLVLTVAGVEVTPWLYWPALAAYSGVAIRDARRITVHRRVSHPSQEDGAWRRADDFRNRPNGS